MTALPPAVHLSVIATMELRCGRPIIPFERSSLKTGLSLRVPMLLHEQSDLRVIQLPPPRESGSALFSRLSRGAGQLVRSATHPYPFRSSQTRYGPNRFALYFAMHTHSEPQPAIHFQAASREEVVREDEGDRLRNLLWRNLRPRA